MKPTANDLTEEAPESPRTRIAGYALLARRADIAGTAGDFHFVCPPDNYLFGFKGVKGADVKPLLEAGEDNAAIAAWLDSHGDPRTEAEKEAWSHSVEAACPYDNPEKKEWFTEVCQEVGIDPATSRLFDCLEADDKLMGKA